MKKTSVWYKPTIKIHSLLNKNIAHPIPAAHPGRCRTSGAGCGAGRCVGGSMCNLDAKPLQFSSFGGHSSDLHQTTFRGTMESQRPFQ